MALTLTRVKARRRFASLRHPLLRGCVFVQSRFIAKNFTFSPPSPQFVHLTVTNNSFIFVIGEVPLPHQLALFFFFGALLTTVFPNCKSFYNSRFWEVGKLYRQLNVPRKTKKKNVSCDLHDLSWQKLFPVEISPDMKLRQFRGGRRRDSHPLWVAHYLCTVVCGRVVAGLILTIFTCSENDRSSILYHPGVNFKTCKKLTL